VPDYYLETDVGTIQTYCKLAKFNQEGKLQKAVAAIVKSRKRVTVKTSLSLKSKVFLPKIKTATNELEVDLVGTNRKFSHESPTLDSPLSTDLHIYS